MPPARDLRRGSRAVAHGAPPGGRLRMCPLIGPDAADAASSRGVGAEPAGKPAIPVSRAGGEPARTGTAGFQPAARAGGSMPPARDLRRGSRAVAHGAPLGGRLRMCPLISSDAADAASSRVGAEPAGKPAIPAAASGASRLESRRSRSAARRRAGSDWDRRLSAGCACRGLDAPGARSAAREPGGCPWGAAGRTTAHVPSDQLRRRRRGIEPRRRRAGWKAGDPGQPRRRRPAGKPAIPVSRVGAEPAGKPAIPVSRAGAEPARTGTAGFQPAARAGGSMPPARDLRRESRAVAHGAPLGGRLRMCPLIGPDAADAASSRVGAEPAGKPAIPVSRIGAEPAGKPAIPVSRRRRAGWKAGGPGQPRRRRAGSDWDRRLSAGCACRGLDAPGARSAAREPGSCHGAPLGRTTAHVPSDQLRRRRRGIEPRRRRAGWKAGDPGQPRRRRAGWKAGDPAPSPTPSNAWVPPSTASSPRPN
jgi:hypothetical protein